jgi:mannosyl-oligosaccharide alpha-1,2-mannosidase
MFKLLIVEKSTRKRHPLTLLDHENKRFFFQKQSKKANFDQQKVINMTKHAWKGYIEFGNWQDALDAEEKSGFSMAKHDMAYTVVDSLDTLFILGLHEEFDNASQWISTHLERKMVDGGVVSFFETTIRSLGGLLSAYYLSGKFFEA